jgi:hypothetical protein
VERSVAPLELLAENCRIFLDVLAYTTAIALDRLADGAVFSHEAASAFRVLFVFCSIRQMLF